MLCGALALSLSANAQDYPAKLIKIIIPFPPGSQLDAVTRILADKMQGNGGSRPSSRTVRGLPATSVRNRYPGLRPMATR